MNNQKPVNGMMTRDEWMAWLEESWAEAQKIAASHGDEKVDAEYAQEPVECMCGICKLGKREWVGLTDEEVSEIIGKEIGFNSCFGPEESFARAIEAKLREKNGG
jgi:hypothetical protein